MKSIWGKLIVIVYVLLFAVNLFFAVVDLDDLFLPEYIKVSESGGLSGHSFNMYSVSREKGKYYINHSIEITREEYKRCVGAKIDFKEPQLYSAGSDAYYYSFRIKYPFEKEEYHEVGYCGSPLAQRIKMLMHDKEVGKETPDIENALVNVFDKYNVKSAYVTYYDGDKSMRNVFYGALYNMNSHKDERYIKINDAFMAELANMRMYSGTDSMRKRGDSGKLYLGTNTKLMAKYVEKNTGKKILDYVPDERGIVRPRTASISNFYASVNFIIVPKKDNRYMTVKASKYYRFRYFDHALKGTELVYFKDRSCDDLTVLVYCIPNEVKNGCIVFETDDYLTRQLLIMEIKLAILTDGKLPVMRGTCLTAHVLFIGMVQTLILAGVMIVKVLIIDRRRTRK